MKSQELRIGNIIWSNDGHFDRLEDVIEVIEPERVSTKLCNTIYMPIENIEPIPLTEEWLIRFGFENWDKNSWQKYISIRKHGEGWLYLSGPLHVNIFYVHQLQNLYFALTGKELTLTPLKPTAP